MQQHPMVYEGKEGWLFLRSDSNQVVAQISGSFDLPEDFAASWRRLLDYRHEQSQQLGYKYAFSIVPNKECVYRAFLPDEVAFSELRPVHAVLGQDRHRLAVYLFENLGQYLNLCPEPLFNKNDTHWTSFGAISGFNLLMQHLGMRPISADAFDRKHEDINGDLGGKIGRTEQAAIYTLRQRTSRLLENNRVANVGSRIVFENEDRSMPTCVVFHDSFALKQLHFFPERFSRVVYVWQPNIDYSVIEEERPDFVISQQIERFLVSVPQDQGGPSQKENELRKLAAG